MITHIDTSYGVHADYKGHTGIAINSRHILESFQAENNLFIFNRSGLRETLSPKYVIDDKLLLKLRVYILLNCEDRPKTSH